MWAAWFYSPTKTGGVLLNSVQSDDITAKSAYLQREVSDHYIIQTIKKDTVYVESCDKEMKRILELGFKNIYRSL